MQNQLEVTLSKINVLAKDTQENPNLNNIINNSEITKELFNEIKDAGESLISFVLVIKDIYIRTATTTLSEEISQLKMSPAKKLTIEDFDIHQGLMRITILDYPFSVTGGIGYDGNSGIRLAAIEIFSQKIREYHKLKESEPIVEAADEGCYIATMVYGNYNHIQVLELRYFRDNVLMNYSLGKLFISLYYKYSPSLVIALEGNDIINKYIRIVLNLFIKLIRY